MTPHNSSPDRSPAADATPRERIRHAAMELFAERGQRGPTLRAVAERADVSPGLVQHHYKTKERLLVEVQSWVQDQLAGLADDALSSAGNLGVDPARYDAFFAANPVVAAYLRRGLLESADGAQWFRDAVAHRRERSAQDKSDRLDPDVTAAMAVLIAMGPVMLGPLLANALGCDEAQLHTQWRQTETALLGFAFNDTH